MTLIYSSLNRMAVRTALACGGMPKIARAIGGLRHASDTTTTERRTALYDFHLEHGGEMYASLSLLKSHLHTRENASLFDVSHMLQSRLTGKDRVKFYEQLTVADLQALPEGHGTLSVYTNEDGGIIDDLIVTNENNSLYIVSNAGCAEKDLKHVREQLDRFKQENPGADVHLETLEDTSLLALQGPKAARVLEQLNCHVARCGYTGEDGFEVDCCAITSCILLAEALVADPDVQLAGLGARDSLRLEAGMCKRRREEGGFLGASKILDQIKNGVDRRRVGLIVTGPAAREGTIIVNDKHEPVGVVTSGCPSPTLKKNIAMAYLKKGYTKTGTELTAIIRQTNRAAKVVKMPFVPPQYHKI
ncbi:hypothetical protein BDF22DRAFT_744956 [Syncephalis plumigaleata]|nr:hypothetical protein BDF22DRAFT_744956 [Syncephalis plumigaleata]